MSEALEAIKDIKQALNDYGSDITIKINVEGVYDPVEGEGLPSITNVVTKALVDNYNRMEMQDPNVNLKDKKFKLFYDGEIDHNDTILFDGKIYSIERIDKKILQNENLMYVIQGRV